MRVLICHARSRLKLFDTRIDGRVLLVLHTALCEQPDPTFIISATLPTAPRKVRNRLGRTSNSVFALLKLDHRRLPGPLEDQLKKPSL